ncbi:MAG: signal peptidase II [Acidobacteria bacterium]|nr:signal peptidase II [Acidobacteriota bacterium]
MSRKRLAQRVNFTVIVVALVVIALDAVTKAWARHTLVMHSIHLFGAAWLRLQFNSGISFSINQSGPLVTSILTAIIAAVVVVVGLRANSGAPAVGFGLLLGGGVANLADRLLSTPHRVTDFISLGSFPVFNLADVSITCGFVVLFIAALRGDRLLTR